VDEPPGVPSVVVSSEQFGRMMRILKAGAPLKVHVELESRILADRTQGYNVLAELPGTDPAVADQIVMLGAHLDSWQAGTGATDDAAGCVVVMEAVRLLKNLDIPLRRTLRIALWSAEEQGLLGSEAYVKNHFADAETGRTLPEYDKLDAYYNLDNGSGKIRGIYLQGNDAVRPIFEQFIEPIRDLGVTTVTIRNTGGTDHLSFDAVGLPGFQFIQDPLDYETRTHHSNMDVYEHASIADLKQAAVVMAWFVYRTAQLDERLPRERSPLKPADDSGEAGEGGE
ncbi:MAG: M20/M25/M40 family metallo-hydrolase, partial [Acidobacteriota bacterium]